MTNEELYAPLIKHCLSIDETYSNSVDYLYYLFDSEKLPNITRVEISSDYYYENKLETIKQLFWNITKEFRLKHEGINVYVHLNTNNGNLKQIVLKIYNNEEFNEMFKNSMIKSKENNIKKSLIEREKETKLITIAIKNTIGE